ncbi:MAG: hypothetical protein WD004_02710 [Actinomycetota bacterium]
MGAAAAGLALIVTLAAAPMPGASAAEPVAGEALDPAPEPAAPSLLPYRGLGAWIDIYDGWAFNSPAATMKRLKQHGVDTVFIETGNYASSSGVYRADDMADLIKGAHTRGMKVVAWYLPGFQNVAFDFRRSMAAIRFHRNGQRFDSFGLDIESPLVKSQDVRSRRLIALSRRIDAHTPASYALGAIIPSPRGMQLVEHYWERFPYQQIEPFYDVWLPMGYYTYRYSGKQAAYDYTRLNTQILRAEVDPAVEIHPLGGIAHKSSDGETEGFVDAVLDDALIGGGLYDVGTSGPEDWRELQRLSV